MTTTSPPSSHLSSPFPTPLNLSTRVPLPTSPPTHLPILGWGSWPSKGATCTESVLSALRAGYRHIDSAQAYKNEAAIGAAVRASGLTRAEIWLTSKVHAKEYPEGEEGVEEVYKGIVGSVRRMNGVDTDGTEDEGKEVKLGGRDGMYLDLMLIHGAAMDKGRWNKVQWLGMERAYREGLVRAIGVSNAGKGLMEEMKEYATVWPPAVNQIELHPWNQQPAATAYCHSIGTIIQAYSPIYRNQKSSDPTLQAVAAKYNKTTAQILIRYALQKGWVPLPKSDDEGRIRENADVFGWEIGKEEMKRLDGLESGPGAAMDEDAWAVADLEIPSFEKYSGEQVLTGTASNGVVDMKNDV